MLTGLPPHYSNNRDEMYSNIINKEPNYPNFLSNDAIKMLKSLLCKDPIYRLGSNNGVEEIKK
jgi:serine/threonine protein kinase